MLVDWLAQAGQAAGSKQRSAEAAAGTGAGNGTTGGKAVNTWGYKGMERRTKWEDSRKPQTSEDQTRRKAENLACMSLAKKREVSLASVLDSFQEFKDCAI